MAAGALLVCASTFELAVPFPHHNVFPRKTWDRLLHSIRCIALLNAMRIALFDLVHRMRFVALVLIRLGLRVRAQVVGVLLDVS